MGHGVRGVGPVLGDDPPMPRLLPHRQPVVTRAAPMCPLQLQRRDRPRSWRASGEQSLLPPVTASAVGQAYVRESCEVQWAKQRTGVTQKI